MNPIKKSIVAMVLGVCAVVFSSVTFGADAVKPAPVVDHSVKAKKHVHHKHAHKHHGHKHAAKPAK